MEDPEPPVVSDTPEPVAVTAAADALSAPEGFRQTLSVSFHFAAIWANVPSSTISFKVVCTSSLSFVFPFLKPIP